MDEPLSPLCSCIHSDFRMISRQCQRDCFAVASLAAIQPCIQQLQSLLIMKPPQFRNDFIVNWLAWSLLHILLERLYSQPNRSAMHSCVILVPSVEKMRHIGPSRPVLGCREGLR